MLQKFLAFSLFSWLGLSLCVPVSAQSCDALLAHGIFDIYDDARTLSSVRTYMDHFCDIQFGSSQQAEDFGASLAFPFKGIPAKLGFDSSHSSWDSWYKSICADHRSGKMDYSAVRSHIQQVNPAIVSAFEKCISADGLHVWLERSEGTRFHVATRFVNPGESQLPTITNFVTPPNVKCELQLQGRKISGATFRVPCERLTNAAVLITINATTNPLGGGNLSLPAVWAPRLAQRPAVESLVDFMQRGGWVDVEWNREWEGSWFKKGFKYRVRYDSNLWTWQAVGPLATGQWRGYEDPRSITVCDRTPTDIQQNKPRASECFEPKNHRLVFWSGDWYFDDQGHILHDLGGQDIYGMVSKSGNP